MSTKALDPDPLLERRSGGEFAAAADPQKYRQPDASLFSCTAHSSAAVLCCTAGKIGRRGGHAAVGATLFWCTCPNLNNLVARMERHGGVQTVNRFFGNHPAARAALCSSNTVFEERARELLHSVDAPLWTFYNSHFIHPNNPAKRKYGNAAVSHPEDVKCLHALVAQELCGAENPVGAAVTNFIVFLYEQLKLDATAPLDDPALFEAFLAVALRAGTAPLRGARLEYLAREKEEHHSSPPHGWSYTWRSLDDLRGLQPDLCAMAHTVIVGLEGHAPRARRQPAPRRNAGLSAEIPRAAAFSPSPLTSDKFISHAKSKPSSLGGRCSVDCSRLSTKSSSLLCLISWCSFFFFPLFLDPALVPLITNASRHGAFFACYPACSVSKMSFVSTVVEKVQEPKVRCAIGAAAVTTAATAMALTALKIRSSTRRKKEEAARPTLPPLEEQQRRLQAFASKPFREECTTTSNVPVPSFPGMRQVVDRFHCKLTLKGSAVGDTPVECLDLTTYDFHSFSSNPQVVDTARSTVMAYGVGSCGPRGFYGTVKPHLDVESDLKDFLNTEDAVIYSFAYATIATLISCFAHKGDYILMDREVCSPVEEGCTLSRANLQIYKHNDMADLERLMQEVAQKDGGKKPHRRLVVTEGIFLNNGDICKLPEIKALCEKYKFRIILDDSYGFAAVGKTGRGTPEHFGMSTSDVDVYVGSMSAGLGCVGGFCAGVAPMVDFQRLGATAYVFSASLPPYLTASASKVLEILSKDSSHVASLQKNSITFRNALREAMSKMKHIVMCGLDISPIVVLRVSPSYREKYGDAAVEDKLQKVVNAVEMEKIAITRHLFSKDERNYNEPSIRIVIKSAAAEADLKAAAATIAHAITTEFE
eukprot:gene4386-3189_t